VNETNRLVTTSLRSLEKLACDEKEMIELQRKTIYV